MINNVYDDVTYAHDDVTCVYDDVTQHRLRVINNAVEKLANRVLDPKALYSQKSSL